MIPYEALKGTRMSLIPDDKVNGTIRYGTEKIMVRYGANYGTVRNYDKVQYSFGPQNSFKYIKFYSIPITV